MRQKPKKRPSKYEKKLKVNATFNEILTGMLKTPPPRAKENVQKRSKKNG